MPYPWRALKGLAKIGVIAVGAFGAYVLSQRNSTKVDTEDSKEKTDPGSAVVDVEHDDDLHGPISENCLDIYSFSQGIYPKKKLGIGFSVAARIISGEIKCIPRIKASVLYGLPFKPMESTIESPHDVEIMNICSYAYNKYDDILEVLIDDWNPEWPVVGDNIFIYGKPDVRITRENGLISIGDAKTGKPHEWHWLQNKVALHAACREERQGSKPHSIMLKYRSSSQTEERFLEEGEPVLSTQEISILKQSLSSFNLDRFDFKLDPSPGNECRFCPFLSACKAGQEVQKT